MNAVGALGPEQATLHWKKILQPWDESCQHLQKKISGTSGGLKCFSGHAVHRWLVSDLHLFYTDYATPVKAISAVSPETGQTVIWKILGTFWNSRPSRTLNDPDIILESVGISLNTQDLHSEHEGPSPCWLYMKITSLTSLKKNCFS